MTCSLAGAVKLSLLSLLLATIAAKADPAKNRTTNGTDDSGGSMPGKVVKAVMEVAKKRVADARSKEEMKWDCLEDLEHFTVEWSAEKQEYCCAHGMGCPGETGNKAKAAASPASPKSDPPKEETPAKALKVKVGEPFSERVNWSPKVGSSFAATAGEGSTWPAWLQFDPVKGRLFGTPMLGSEGTAAVKVKETSAGTSGLETQHFAYDLTVLVATSTEAPSPATTAKPVPSPATEETPAPMEVATIAPPPAPTTVKLTTMPPPTTLPAVALPTIPPPVPPATATVATSSPDTTKAATTETSKSSPTVPPPLTTLKLVQSVSVSGSPVPPLLNGVPATTLAPATPATTPVPAAESTAAPTPKPATTQQFIAAAATTLAIPKFVGDTLTLPKPDTCWTQDAMCEPLDENWTLSAIQATAENADECQLKCRARADCGCFSYYPDLKSCHFASATASLMRDRLGFQGGSANCDKAMQGMKKTTIEQKLLAKKCMTNASFIPLQCEGSATTTEDDGVACRRRCASHSWCTSFVHNTLTKSCDLQCKGATPVAAPVYSLSGPPTCSLSVLADFTITCPGGFDSEAREFGEVLSEGLVKVAGDYKYFGKAYPLVDASKEISFSVTKVSDASWRYEMRVQASEARTMYLYQLLKSRATGKTFKEMAENYTAIAGLMVLKSKCRPDVSVGHVTLDVKGDTWKEEASEYLERFSVPQAQRRTSPLRSFAWLLALASLMAAAAAAWMLPRWRLQLHKCSRAQQCGHEIEEGGQVRCVRNLPVGEDLACPLKAEDEVDSEWCELPDHLRSDALGLLA